MEIKQERKENMLTIAPIGRIDSATSGELSDFIDQNVTSEIEKIILNFEDVDFISSKGLRVIISLYKNLEKVHRTFSNENPIARIL